MNQHSFHTFFERFTSILAEGAVIERLRRMPDMELDPHVVNSAFIYDDSKRTAIEAIYRQYLDIGQRYDLPMLLSTPTWRASRERIAAAGLEKQDVNGDNFRFLDAIRESYGSYAQKVAICGLTSCRGDAYDPAAALSSEAAKRRVSSSPSPTRAAKPTFCEPPGSTATRRSEPPVKSAPNAAASTRTRPRLSVPLKAMAPISSRSPG